jgi:hypothetical protein
MINPTRSDPTVADQAVMLYRTGHLTKAPDTPGGQAQPVTELLFLHQYGPDIIATIPGVDIGHQIVGRGAVVRVEHVDDFVAAARFRAITLQYLHTPDTDRDGTPTRWRLADPDSYHPADLTRLRPLPAHEYRQALTRPSRR